LGANIRRRVMKCVLVPVVAARGHRAGAVAALGLLFGSPACRRAAPPAPPPPRAAAVVNGAPIPVTRVQLELDRMPRASAEGDSPAGAGAFYDTRRGEFEEPESVHCLQISVRTPEEAKSVLDQLRAGAAFDKLARQAGTSPDARNGGDLGWFSKGTMPKVFDDTCFSLGNNKISGVVASPYGYHVFKVLGRRGPRTLKFEDVKAEIERRATAEKRAQAERQL